MEHGGRGFRAGRIGLSAARTAEFRGVGIGARGQEVQGSHVCGTCRSSTFRALSDAASLAAVPTGSGYRQIGY